jgi:cytochrome c553
MLQRTLGILTLGLLLICGGPALAQQSAKARATANVDLTQQLADVQSDPPKAEAMLKLGAKTANFCANCHGMAGNSVKPEVPNLASQNPAYMLEQLRQFADGRRRFEFMEGLIKAMTSDEKIGIVIYYAAQKPPVPNVPNTPQLIKGKELYQKNCATCHGTDGHGNHQLARIAGQQVTYLENTLKRYRDTQGKGPRTDASMVKVTSALNDAEVKAVVTYLSSMP